MDATPIPLLDLEAQNAPLRDQIRVAMDRVIAKNAFVLGDETKSFEALAASLLGVEHAIAIRSGTDAQLIGMMALGIGPGDEVITTPFTFVATGECIARLGAQPVYVDIDPRTFLLDPALLERAITSRTKAIAPVHLYGQPVADEVFEIASRHGIPVIEDCAQAIGAHTAHGSVGGRGLFGWFSFYPTKNVGAFGDGGLLTTRDAAFAERVRTLRVHGMTARYHHELVGGNFRLDALQAAVLSVKLPHVTAYNTARRALADRYDAGLRARLGVKAEELVPLRRQAGHVYNQYVIRTPHRDALRAGLTERKIASEIYYPIPLHRQRGLASRSEASWSMPEADRAAAEVLALPIFPELGEARVDRVVEAVAAILESTTGARS